ncbi:MAG TPA: hypothetical protein VEK37_05610, partial [Gemmatimonadaceae bacterium]|nr:hypothetical protein [Gemmatimonadaceae bacterium]
MNSLRARWTIAAVMALGAACTQQQQTSSYGKPDALMSSGWIDATATLDPATTPVYEGDATMKFDFLKDMRRGDALTL